MGYQESFIYSKTGNNTNIEKTIEIIKKYGYQQYEPSIGEVSVLKSFSNGHKQRYPVLNWPIDTKLLIAAGERYYQRGIGILFAIKNNRNPNSTEDEEDYFIEYADDELKVLDNLDIIYIDDYVDPKLKEDFSDYFSKPKAFC